MMANEFQPPGLKLPDDNPPERKHEEEDDLEPETLPSRSKLQWILMFLAVAFATAAVVSALRKNPKILAKLGAEMKPAQEKTGMNMLPISDQPPAQEPSQPRSPYPPQMIELEKKMIEHLRKNPNDTKMMANLTNLYVEEQRYDEAMQLLAKIRTIEPQYPRLNTTVAYISELAGATQQAAQFYGAALQNPEDNRDPVLYERFGALLAANGDPQNAEKIFLMGLKIKPDSLPILFSMGNLYNQSKQFAKAEGYYKKLLHTGHVDKDGFRPAECYYGLAYAEVMQKKYQASLIHIKRTLTYAPNSPQAYQLLAQAFRGLKKPKEAAQAEARAQQLIAALQQMQSQAAAQAQQGGAPAPQQQVPLQNR